MKDKMILNTSAEAAKFVEGISGWVSRGGRFYGTDERMARYDGATHTECTDCGAPVQKSWTKCDDCREKTRIEKFMALECKKWDGKTPLYLDGSDTYFFDDEALQCYIDENECKLDDLQLCLCKPVKMRMLDEDYFLDDMHEDAEIPDVLADAIEALNKVVGSLSTQTWEPDKYAAIIEL